MIAWQSNIMHMYAILITARDTMYKATNSTLISYLMKIMRSEPVVA